MYYLCFFRKLLAGMAVMTCMILPATGNAATIDLTAILEASQEVPPTGSTATGSGSMTFDDVTNQLSWEIIFNGLTAPASGAHFHGPAPIGNNAGVQVNIGAISGLTSPMIGSVAINRAQAIDLLDGLWYINLHTSTFPGGEIRGQVSVIPLPAAIWLFVSGIAAMFCFSTSVSKRPSIAGTGAAS